MVIMVFPPPQALPQCQTDVRSSFQNVCPPLFQSNILKNRECMCIYIERVYVGSDVKFGKKKSTYIFILMHAYVFGIHFHTYAVTSLTSGRIWTHP